MRRLYHFFSFSRLVSSEPLRRSQQLLAPLRTLRAYRTRQSEIVRNPSSARFFWPAGLSFRCESCCVRWDRGGSCAPSVAVCRSLRRWDIRYEEPSGSSACRRSILPTRLPEIASLVQVPDFSYPLPSSSQPHSARPSTRLAEIWSSLAVAAGLLAVAISTPPFWACVDTPGSPARLQF